MHEGVELKILRGTAELLGLEAEWRTLWAADETATPFQSPEWLLPWWRQFGHGQLRALTIHRNRELIGLLPCYIYRDPKSGERQLLLMGVGTSDYLDIVSAPQCSEDHVLSALDLLQTETGWDAMYLSQLRPASKLYRALRRWKPAMRRVRQTEGCSRMPALAMPELPQKIRRNAMYYRNRAMRAGELEFAIAEQHNCVEWFEALRRLHTERWQASGEPGVLAEQDVLAWHRESVPLMQQCGLLRMCALTLNNEIIAVLYAMIDPPGRRNRTQYFYLTAYSNRHAELRPGTLLLAYAMEHAAQEGVETIDILRGDESYKTIWHMHKEPTFGVALRRADAENALPGEEAA